MNWSNPLIMEFLDLYESEPVIWNPSHGSHKNRSEVTDAWKRIQRQISVKCSVNDLKRKKESLMSTYRLCSRKARESLQSEEGACGVYKTTWFAYAKMESFLKTGGQQRETSSPEFKLEWYNDIDSACANDDTVNDHGSTENVSIPEISNVDQKDIFIPTLSSFCTSSLKIPTRKQRQLSGDGQLKSEKLKTGRDECDLYGELIASKLRKMDERSRDISMNRIDNFLFEIKINSYENS